MEIASKNPTSTTTTTTTTTPHTSEQGNKGYALESFKIEESGARIKRQLFSKSYTFQHIISTQKKYVWGLKVGAKIFSIEAINSLLTGRIRVLVDDREIHNTGRFGSIMTSFSFKFKIDTFTISIIEGEEDFYLRVDNCSLKSKQKALLEEEQKKLKKMNKTKRDDGLVKLTSKPTDSDQQVHIKTDENLKTTVKGPQQQSNEVAQFFAPQPDKKAMPQETTEEKLPLQEKAQIPKSNDCDLLFLDFTTQVQQPVKVASNPTKAVEPITTTKLEEFGTNNFSCNKGVASLNQVERALQNALFETDFSGLSIELEINKKKAEKIDMTLDGLYDKENIFGQGKKNTPSTTSNPQPSKSVDLFEFFQNK